MTVLGILHSDDGLAHISNWLTHDILFQAQAARKQAFCCSYRCIKPLYPAYMC